MKRVSFILLAIAAAAVPLIVGTFHNPHFWRTAERKGDALLREKRFADAAKTYGDPLHIGVAQYRDGAFEAAAHTFARVPGAVGDYNQGNAWLMHGKYDQAIACYDRALKVRSGWQEALENRALAAARKAALDASGKDREQEQADAYEPDDIVQDQKGEDSAGKEIELGQSDVSDEALRATWLRQVKTKPGEFLKAKFAFQASQETMPKGVP